MDFGSLPEDIVAEYQERRWHVGHKFQNPWPSSEMHGFWGFLKAAFKDWDFWMKPTPQPIFEPHFADVPTAPELTFLGHSSCLLRFDGVSLLTDPMFDARASPVPFAGPARYTAKIEAELPRVDICVVSHNHYDHCSKNSLQRVSRDNPECVFVCPLGLAALLQGWGLQNVVELDWWQSTDIPVEDTKVHVVCTPCQHFSGRSVFDSMKSLWASFVVIGESQRVFFAGDTGYRTVPKGFEGKESELEHCPAFQHIGDAFGPFDLALIPVGAYSPRWFMSPVHFSPEDAVEVAGQLRAKACCGVHCLTYCMTDEPSHEPLARLRTAVEALGGKDPSWFVVLKHGVTTNVGVREDGVVEWTAAGGAPVEPILTAEEAERGIVDDAEEGATSV